MPPPPARTSLSMTTPWPGREGSSPGRLPGRAVVPKKEEKEGCCIFLMVVISWVCVHQLYHPACINRDEAFFLDGVAGTVDLQSASRLRCCGHHH
nr:PREDICTED: uncharacterized protein LOC108953647 isoform X2 [Musa acuminata subsp. malaccensis]